MKQVVKVMILMGMLFMTSGCAMGIDVNNKIRMLAVEYNNRGENDVYDFMIEFGKYKIPSADKDDVFVKGGGGTFINQMPLPETMNVLWREKNNVIHNEVVEIARYVPKDRDFNIVVNIRDSNLEVYIKTKKDKVMDINHIEYDKIPIREK